MADFNGFRFWRLLPNAGYSLLRRTPEGQRARDRLTCRGFAIAAPWVIPRGRGCESGLLCGGCNEPVPGGPGLVPPAGEITVGRWVGWEACLEARGMMGPGPKYRRAWAAVRLNT
jgi:hypothetical protein